MLHENKNGYTKLYFFLVLRNAIEFCIFNLTVLLS